MKKQQKLSKRARIKTHIRKRVNGTEARPRLTVFRSLNHIYAQVIDDTRGVTLASASTVEAGLKGQVGDAKPVDVARMVGRAVAEKALAANVTQVVFDRNGYLYHGRVKSLADGAREGGLQF